MKTNNSKKGEIDHNLLIDFFYLPAKAPKATKKPEDVEARIAAIKDIQRLRGCSYMKARQIWLAQ